MMKTWICALLIALGAAVAHGQVRYSLNYPEAGAASVEVRIDLAAPRSAPAELVMPRNYPGGYSLVLYDNFVENVQAFSPDGKALAVKAARFGPRWVLGVSGERVARVEYRVNVVKMEQQLLSAVDTSKVRAGYAGLLGYSVFAYVDGTENDKIGLRVTAPGGWPVLSTLDARVPAPAGEARVAAENYYHLADSEIFMGPDLRLRKLDGLIQLVVAIYSEGKPDGAAEMQLARTALDRVQRYFGDVPFPAYTVQLEILKPLPGHDYNFSQEHWNSGTFIESIDDALTENSKPEWRDGTLLNFAHHMAHSWIPKRVYGEGYMPVLWEMPASIDTIWFNEGFGRYAGIAAVVDGMPPAEGAKLRAFELQWIGDVVKNAPDFIQRMSTVTLSREASFLYSTDFRTGMNSFSRGSMMAAEMDDVIREKTHGQKSLRDGLRAMLARMEHDPRPLRIDELPAILEKGTGVDVTDVMRRWLEPTKK